MDTDIFFVALRAGKIIFLTRVSQISRITLLVACGEKTAGNKSDTALGNNSICTRDRRKLFP